MNLRKAWKAFWTPRFTTEQVENATTKSKNLFSISFFIYDDDTRQPIRAVGYVSASSGELLKVNWNQYGECHHKGERMKEYDLVHPDQKENDAAKPLFFALIGILIIIIFTL